MTPAVFGISVGTFGAVLQELLYWYNGRTKLDSDEHKTILESKRYWFVVVAMTIASGVAAYVWFLPEHQSSRTYLLFGAAFPVLFKKAVDAFTPKAAHLGALEAEKKNQIWRNYFRAS